MNNINALLIMKNELECVKRNIHGCNRDCLNCDLVKPDKDIIDAFEFVINLLEQNGTR